VGGEWPGEPKTKLRRFASSQCLLDHVYLNLLLRATTRALRVEIGSAPMHFKASYEVRTNEHRDPDGPLWTARSDADSAVD